MAIAGNGIEIIISASLGGLTAQSIKIIAYLLQHRRLNFRLFFETGGMPSSHSATMCAMATSVGLISGFTSVDFAIAAGIAMIVMYDAAGLRRAAGRMAGVLNRIAEDFYTHHHDSHLPERLKELLGHTPFQVLIGALYGIILALVLHIVFAAQGW